MFVKPLTPAEYGFVRVAAAVPRVTVADPISNARAIIDLATDIMEQSAPDIIVFPEMSVTAYTCADLFHNSELLDGALRALDTILVGTSAMDALIVVGMPLKVDGLLYNCALAVYGGKVLAVIPKTYVPDYNEFYEKRWWRPAPLNVPVQQISLGVGTVQAPFGRAQIVEHKGVKVGFEICEDLWTPVPASTMACLQGAEVVVNLSASDALTGKYNYIKGLVQGQSARCLCAYAYASAGFGESSTDLVFDGIALIAERGHMLAANKRWQKGGSHAVADIDLLAIRRDRMHITSWGDSVAALTGLSTEYDVQKGCDGEPAVRDELLRTVDPYPFVPADDSRRDERCQEIVNIQSAGLQKRLVATGCKNVVVGISGGLDSTLALLVAVHAFDSLGLPRKGIVGVTMPGFGTTGRTHNNAVALMDQLGVTTRDISIVPAVTQHFQDIGHDPEVHDVTYENSQARQRTYLLMDIANQVGGMVVGTGDLSELALGWATYNGDHMSMYGVNAGVPKTLVRHLVRWFAGQMDDAKERHTLLDIVDTPVSPELIPANADGTINQKTEDLVGPYDLHDFFLYYMLRFGFTPQRIEMLARIAFAGQFSDEVIHKWLKTFMRRFFIQQFKRSCLPDGPKVGSVCLSPRGDWRMPSDASSALWLDSLGN